MSCDLEAAWAVRRAVFVVEQGVPEDLEIDALDTLNSTLHVVEYADDGRAVATGRAVLDGPGHVHLGRIAVLRDWRGRGLGVAVVRRLESEALRRYGVVDAGVRCVELALAAQEHAIGFYQALGYELTQRGRFLDAGIWHRDMRRAACERVSGPT